MTYVLRVVKVRLSCLTVEGERARRRETSQHDRALGKPSIRSTLADAYGRRSLTRTGAAAAASGVMAEATSSTCVDAYRQPNGADESILGSR